MARAISPVASLCCSTDVAHGIRHGINFGHGRRDRSDIGDGLMRRHLYFRDLRRDLVRSLRGVPRQRLHFRSHHGKALAGVAGARRLDGGVQRQQIGLLRDRADHVDDRAHPVGKIEEAGNIVVGVAGDFGRLARPLAGPVNLAARFR